MVWSMITGHVLLLSLPSPLCGFPSPRKAVDALINGYIQMNASLSISAIDNSSDKGREFAKVVVSEIELWKATKQMEASAMKKFGKSGLKLIRMQKLYKYDKERFANYAKGVEIYLKEDNPNEALAYLPNFARQYIHLERSATGWIVTPKDENTESTRNIISFAKEMLEKTRSTERKIETATTLDELRKSLESDR